MANTEEKEIASQDLIQMLIDEITDLRNMKKEESDVDKFIELSTSISSISDKIDGLVDDMAKLKEVAYNPETGLYSRVKTIENWKATCSKIYWVIGSCVVTVLIGLILNNTFNKSYSNDKVSEKNSTSQK